RPDEILDQRVEGVDRLAPGSLGALELRPFGHLALAPDDLADALQLVGERLASLCELVERLRNVAHDPAVLRCEPQADLPVLRRAESVEQQPELLFGDLDRALRGPLLSGFRFSCSHG